MQRPELGWVARADRPGRLGWLAVFAWGVAVAHAGPSAPVAGGALPAFVPVLTASAALVGARLLSPELEQGRYARVQIRLALPVPNKAGGPWRVAAHATYGVDCDASPPVAVLAGRELWGGVGATGPSAEADVNGDSNAESDSAQGSPGVVAAWHAVHTPPEAGVAAAFACLAARPGYLASEVAQVVQQTAGLGALEHLDCTLTQKANGGGMQLAMTLSDDPPAVRLGEKWLSAGVITPAYVAVTDAGLDIRLLRSTGALRVVSRAEMSSVALGECVPHLPKKAKKDSGW